MNLEDHFIMNLEDEAALRAHTGERTVDFH